MTAATRSTEPKARRVGGEPLLLIDSATSGCAGLYIDEIHRHLPNPDEAEVAVSAYFPFPYGKRIFFRFSELHAQRRYRLGRFRLYVRMLELLVAVARLFVHVIRRRTRIVAYAISSNLFVEYLFLWAVSRFTPARVYLICHDVIPYLTKGEDYERKLNARARFYRLADMLVAHNENSVVDLIETFGVDPKRIIRVPFPLRDLRRIRVDPVPVPARRAARRFLFIGHLRPEKGIEVLVDAWRLLRTRGVDAELIVAGNRPRGSQLDRKWFIDQGIESIDHYLSDDEYISLIRSADFVVLPYVRGTNSGIVSDVLSLGTPVLASDIPMFSNDPLIAPECFFESENPASLAARMEEAARLTEGQRDALRRDIVARWTRFQERFAEDVKAAFA
jgi:glycosyltransferase involved in cell wall biosynthesis